MFLGEGFGVRFRWVVGGGFPVKNKGKGVGVGVGVGVATGKGTGKSMRKLCRNYPSANFSPPDREAGGSHVYVLCAEPGSALPNCPQK